MVQFVSAIFESQCTMRGTSREGPRKMFGFDRGSPRADMRGTARAASQPIFHTSGSTCLSILMRHHALSEYASVDLPYRDAINRRILKRYRYMGFRVSKWWAFGSVMYQRQLKDSSATKTSSSDTLNMTTCVKTRMRK